MNPNRASLGAKLSLSSFSFLLISVLFFCVTSAAAQETTARPAATPASKQAHATPVRKGPNAPAVSSQPRPVALLVASLPVKKSFKTVTPPTTVTPLPAYVATEQSTQLEQRVFTLTNETRTKAGLSPLVWDEDAAKLARAHVTNMAQTNFFNHLDPQGRDVAARARELGARGWRALGENIAYNQGFDQPADFAVERWLKSFSHRENILSNFFTHTAIGVALAPDGRLFFTQTFLVR